MTRPGPRPGGERHAHESRAHPIPSRRVRDPARVGAAAAIPVADGIWLSPGLSNSYLVVTPEGRVVINTGMGFESGPPPPAVRRGRRRPGAVHPADPGPRRPRRWRRHVPRARARCSSRRRTTRHARPTTSASTASGSGAASPTGHPRSPRPTRSSRASRRTRRSPRSRQPTPDVLFDDAYAFELGGTRFELHLDPRRRDDRLHRHLAPRPRHRVRRQRLQRAVRPLPEPGDAAGRPAALPAPVRRRGAARHRPRARDPLHRALRPDRRARHDPRRARRASATRCST